MKRIIPETARLQLREMEPSDIESLSSILQDSNTMYAYNGAFNGEETMIWIQKQLQRYKDFGCFAARMDDAANYIPARITAVLMVLSSGRLSLFSFVKKYGNQHASPNSGYPEAALAGILDCRFGGPHNYFGEEVWKPFIGVNDRLLTTADMTKAVRINQMVEMMFVGIIVIIDCIIYLF